MCSPHISPVGSGPSHIQLKYKSNMILLSTNSNGQFVTGPVPIPALTCSDTNGLELPSNHSYGYGSQSSPAPSRICPAPFSGILVNYASESPSHSG
jgi:hypothetical protein